MKGSAATVGALAARDAAQRLEQASVAGDWEAFDAHLPTLRLALELLSGALSEITASAHPGMAVR